MSARSATSKPQHSYPPSPWTATSSSTSASLESTNGPAHSQSSESPPDATAHPAPAGATTTFASHLDFLPFLFPQQNIYQAQLLHYNKLISPARGGGLQTPPLPPVVSSPHVQAGPRSRSSSRVSLKDGSANQGAASGGNGSRSHHNSGKNNRLVITPKDTPSKMPPKQSAETSRNVTQRSNAAASLSHGGQTHSSSVPSTPHQHARQFSFESREPSPNAANNHSPRSAYSETNSTLPSLRPLPPRLGGCKYETAQINSRRRIPYSVGNDRLEKLDLRIVKQKLSEDEDKKLATDMREIFDRLLPTPEVEEKRKKLVQKLETLFNDEWPGHDIRVNLFGSSGNLLCSDDSDLDICITTSWRELEGVCIIADLLARRGMEKVVCISAAKVPIVKIWDPELGLACDMNVNNTLALENTRMVRIYVEADPRVRQLAMIIKYWTRRRIVNDAAFGSTLSSYTWICLIIAFLQLRNPPVLPALHQLPYKMPKSDGTVSDFADNLKKIRGCGNKNKSSVAELLFHFFRFFAHEFDYDKYVLSVRQGKLVTKQDKKWNYAINNQLCVEEPFNVSRNLGNTVDEYSFRGVHLELRRAFDLLSQAKLEEACEQYVFPKEEERVWTRPPPQPRPVLLRSSSQTHSGRGGRGNHRGGRHNHNNNNNNFHRNGGSNRRASSSVPTYDANMFMAPLGMQQDISWLQNQHYQFQYAQQDLMTQMAYHHESMRQFQLYAQSPALLQHQAMGQPQRLSASSASGGQQSSDRSRTNSFDNVPTSATLRPDLYALYGMNLGHTFFPQTSYGTYPSTPATPSTSTGQDFRRPFQRSTGSTEGGTSVSSSSLRSQSQPAQRSPSANPGAGYSAQGSQTPTGATVASSKIINGVPIPSFISDDADFDETPKAVSDSPESLDARAASFFQLRNISPTRQPPQPQQLLPNGIAFGDLAAQSSSPERRRLSTDQLPQTLLDRRMRRASRSPSPSPLGHARAFSVGGTASAPLASAPFPGSQGGKASTRPLVVNGSGLKTAVSSPSQRQSGGRIDPLASDDWLAANMDNALHITAAPVWPVPPSVNAPLQPSPSSHPSHTSQIPLDRPPIVVNGSGAPLTMPHPSEDASFRERIAMMNSFYLSNQLNQQEVQSGNVARLSPSARQRLMSRQPQNGVIAPLDLAIGDNRVGNKHSGADTLSPVYETRTPPPSTLRKQGAAAPTWLPSKPATKAEGTKATAMDARKEPQPNQDRTLPRTEVDKSSAAHKPSTTAAKSAAQRENGHVRAAKSEGDGGWQKASGKGKKKANNAASTHPSQVELPPKNESDRKGG
ncbi:hypothetical protein QQS21_008210 [Conoideocrella luteorostrata]|uniref:polynucleotide adenylyltransferase n=1 Tax=Conoideocrella luteorostrata TaxID=1105319 RepID=A0AAJ0CJ94_9HYPO|nr:hypothetical protein QQS21_008210 [Conoideocrella luteorostrata]